MGLRRLCLALAANLVVVAGSDAAEPGSAPIPGAFSALKGCWLGNGEAVGKRVVIALSAKPILQDAMFAIDVESSAVADPKDRYSAHLVFGGADRGGEGHGDDITGFWADSFGGAYAASGRGRSRPDGFDMTYPYPNATFVNRWTLSGDRLTWTIVKRDGKGLEKPFAAYGLNRVAVWPAASCGSSLRGFIAPASKKCSACLFRHNGRTRALVRRNYSRKAGL